MEKKRVELVIHKFVGARFEDHGLDIDVLDELIAYKDILVETAKELWRRNNPRRQRLPRNFEEALTIKFYKILEGSTAIPLEREIEYDPATPTLDLELRDELDEAVELVAEAEEAINNGRQIPDRFPKILFSKFESYGKTLQEGEYFEQKPAKSSKAVVYSSKTRERMTERAEGEYEDVVDIIGEVRSADLDGLRFKLKQDDGSKIEGLFNDEQEVIITEALREHESQRLRIKGMALFTSPAGKIKSIISVDEMILRPVGESEFDPNAKPIWKIAAEIGASVPDEEWEKVPTDLSKNLDHYLYGAPKKEK